MGLWPLSWQWWCHAIFCANTQEWYGWQICLLRELKKLFSWQFFPKIQICPLWVLKFSAMCKSALRKKFDLIFWAQILVFQKFSFSHIWRTQNAIRICKKKSLKNLANLPFLRVSAEEVRHGWGGSQKEAKFCVTLNVWPSVSSQKILGRQATVFLLHFA